MPNTKHKPSGLALLAQYPMGAPVPAEDDPDHWDDLQDEEMEDVLHPPGYGLLLDWMHAECRLLDGERHGSSLIHLRAPADLYLRQDLLTLAQESGCVLYLADCASSAVKLIAAEGGDAPRHDVVAATAIETKATEDACFDPVELCLLPANPREADAILARDYVATQRRIWLWVTEAQEGLSPVPVSRQLVVDLTTPLFRPFLVRHWWATSCRLGWGEEIGLSDGVFEELCALPLNTVRPALNLLLSHQMAGEDLERLHSLGALEQIAYLTGERGVPTDRVALCEWALEVLADSFRALRFSVCVVDADRLRCEMNMLTRAGSFEVACRISSGGALRVSSRCEQRFDTERVSALMGVVNEWNRRAELCAVVVCEDDALGVTVSGKLAFPVQVREDWARRQVQYWAQQLGEFWLLHIDLAQEE